MPRKPSRKVSNGAQTSCKQDYEAGPSQDSVTSHSSALSQDTLVVDQADRVSTQESLPSRPTRVAKVKCLQLLPAATSSDSESVEEHEHDQDHDRQCFNEQKRRANKNGKIEKIVKERQQLLETKELYKENKNIMKIIEQYERRLERIRQYNANYKANESVEQRQRRLEKKRQYNAIYNSKKHFEQRQQGTIRRKYDISEKNFVQHYREQQERKRLYDKKRRADAKRRADVTTKNESVADRERRLEKRRQYSAIRRSKESIEQRQKRLEWRRQYNDIRSSKESIEQRQRRLERQRQYMTKYMAEESVERREQRLEKKRKHKAKMRGKNKINKDGQCVQNRQKGATRESVEHNCVTRDGDDDVENIKTGQSNEVSEKFPYICYQKHEGAEMHGDGLKEIKQYSPECGDIDSSEQRELSEEQLRQLAIKHVYGLRVICHRINIQQYLPKYLSKESVEHQHLPKITEYGTIQTVSESVKERNLQDVSTRVANEIVKQHQQDLEEQHKLYPRDKGRASRDADILDTVANIKTEPNNQEYDQLCEVTAWDSITDLTPNVNGDIVYEFDSLDGISSNDIRTDHNVLEEEYEVRRVLKMEIDIESEGVQLTTPKENNLKVDNITVQDITDDVMQKLLEEQEKENIVEATSIDTITENTETRPLRPPPRRHARRPRFNESEKRERQRKQNRENMARRLANETVEERQRRLEKKRLYNVIFKSKESDEQRQQRLERQRQYNVSKLKASGQVRNQRNERYPRILELKANESVEEREQRLLKLRELAAKSKPKKPGGKQKCLDSGSVEGNEESEQLCSASTSISDPLLTLPITRAAKVKCLRKIAEALSKESSGDESPVTSRHRYQQHEGHRLKEIKQCSPKYVNKDSSEQRELSEEKLRQLAIKHVDALRVICHRINIREYMPTYRIKESVEKDEQHLPKIVEYGTKQTVSECLEKHKLHDVPTRIADETVEQHEQGLEEPNELILSDKKIYSRNADTHLYTVAEIKTEPSNGEYDPLCEVTASDSIADPKRNVNGEIVYEFDSLDGISSNDIRTEDNVLEEEYEVRRCLKMEIDVESEGIQQTEFKETNSMADNNKVQDIIQDAMHTILEKQLKEGFVDATSTDTTTENIEKILNKREYRGKSVAKKSDEKQQRLDSVEDCLTEGCSDVGNIKTQASSEKSEKMCYICQQQKEQRLRLKTIQQGPEHGDKDSSKQSQLSEGKLRQHAINSVNALRQTNPVIRQYVPKHRKKISVEQNEQHLPKIIAYGTQTTSKNVEKRELQDIAIRIADETVEQHEQGLEKQHELNLSDKEGCSKNADTHLITVEDIQTEPKNQENDQVCEVTPSDNIADPKPNVSGDILYGFDSLPGITSNDIKNKDNILEEEYKDKIALIMEIDAESERVQQTTPEEKNSMAANIIVQDIIEDVTQKPLEEQRKEDIVDATNIDTTTENIELCDVNASDGISDLNPNVNGEKNTLCECIPRDGIKGPQLKEPKDVEISMVDTRQIKEAIKHQAIIKDIKTEPNSQDYEQHYDNSSSETKYPLKQLTDVPRLMRTSKSKCLLMISKVVRGESPPDVIINIRKCQPKQRSNKTVEQDEHHLPKVTTSQTVSGNVKKHELPDVSTRIADKTVEHAKQDGLKVGKEDGEVRKDVTKEVMRNYDFVNIKTGPITQEYFVM